MSTRKSSNNGFFEFCLRQQRTNPDLEGVSKEELVKKCSPLWCKMTAEEKKRISKKNWNTSPQAPVGGLDSYGRPLSQLVNRAQKEKMEMDAMKAEIKFIIDKAIDNQSLEDTVFYILHTSVFCLTAEGGVVPAELSIARMSLKEGVHEIYHVFIDPGMPPKGYMAECIETAEATHKIPLDLPNSKRNYQEIVEDLIEFLLDHSEDLPPIYCLPKFNRQNKLVLDWLLSKIRQDFATEIKFRFLSLPVLLYELAREDNRSIINSSFSVSTFSGYDFKVPTISIAEAQLGRDTFIYIPGLSCKWHEDIETIYCTTSIVNSYCYMIFSLCCQFYGIDLKPGKHCPLDDLSVKVAESITTTSICSHDIESERSLDIRLSELEHPLNAMTIRHHQVYTNNSIEEWEKFGYQEQEKSSAL